MLQAIKHGLRNLANFEGRDARQAFWYFVLFVYVVTMAITMAVTVPMTIQGVMVGAQQTIAAGEMTDAQSDAMIRQATMSAMVEFMPIMGWLTIACATILLLSLATSIVRRLHDADLSGYWALVPLGLQAISIALLPGEMETMLQAMQVVDPEASMGAMSGAIGPAGLSGWAAIACVIILGVRKSTPGPNRFGETPFIA